MIIDRCKIARTYVFGWFLIDVVSILPFDTIWSALDGNASSNANYNVLARFARIGKLYKLIRMTRLAKLLKMFQKKAVLNQLTEFMKISNGVERLLMFGLFFLFFQHISACIYVLIAQVEYVPESWFF